MNLNKRIVGIFFAVAIMIGVQTIAYAAEEPQHPLMGNDYVLRSCMSSVELDTRNIDGTKSRSGKTPENIRNSQLPSIQSPESRHTKKSGGNKARERSRQRLDRQVFSRGRPGRKMIADTPLVTLNVERRGRKNVPQTFVRKEQLPEIKSSLSDGRREKKNEASIIVIESARQFPSDS